MTMVHPFEPFLKELAALSGAVILPYFRAGFTVTGKKQDVFDPVTEADRAAELAIRKRINERFSDHGILGEEYGPERLDAEHVWVIDPIDGTRSFICGIPLWGTLIGLKTKGIPALGCMNQPYTGELFTGDCNGAELTRNGVGIRLRSRDCAKLDTAYLATTNPYLFQGTQAARFEAVARQVKLARYGTDCYAYCMVAAGQLDLVIEDGLQPYDIVPLIPVIEGAGGIVTNWEGGPAGDGGAVIAAGGPRIHQAALAALNS